MKRVSCFTGLMVALNIMLPRPSFALGLAARFGDVVVENAEIGKTYNLREAVKVPFGIENKSNAAVDVTVEFEQPVPKAILTDYVAIPDPGWLKSLPEKITIGPKSIGFFDLMLTIPNDPSLNGKHFQAVVKARTVGTGLFGVAVENRLRFSIGPGPESLKEEKRQKALARLDFNVTPQVIYVVDVPQGKMFDVKAEQNKSIKVANYSPDPLPIKFTSSPWESQLYKPGEYEPIPDPSWITIKPEEKKVAGEEIAAFEFFVKVPNDPKYKGKKFAAMIKSGLSTGFWLDAPVRVFISVKE